MKKTEIKELEKLEDKLKNEDEEIHTRGLEEESETIRQEGKRRKSINKISTKKRKLEPLVDWGEVKEDSEPVEITEWFQSIREEELDHLDETEDWRSRPSQQIDRKLKQLELNFRGILCERLVERKVEKEDDTEVAGEVTTTPTIVEKDPGLEEHPSYVRRTGKISKKEGKKLAAGNGKVSSWLRNMTREKEEEKILYNTRRMEKEIIDDMELIQTPDPGLEIGRIVRVKEAAYKKERNINKYIVGNVVKEIMDMVIPLSMSSNIIDILMSGWAWLELFGMSWQRMTN